MSAIVPIRRVTGRVLASASVPIAPVDPLACFAAARRTGEDAAYWLQPATGRSFVGVGAATSIDVTGPSRFPAAAAAWAGLLANTVTGGPAAGRPGAGPVLLGGATFADSASTDPCWTGFEQGRLDVPALMLTTIDGETILTGTVVLDEGADGPTVVAALLERVGTVLGSWSADAPVAREDHVPILRELGGQPDRVDWSSSVARSSGAVGRGRIDKVVLARRVDIEASEPIDVVAVLGRLATPSDRDGHGPRDRVRVHARRTNLHGSIAGATRRGPWCCVPDDRACGHDGP